MVRYILAFLVAIAISNISQAQLGPAEIIKKSIEFHDPDGLLNQSKVVLTLKESRPNGSDRQTVVQLNESKEYCKIVRKSDGNEIMMQLKKDKPSFKVNGSSKISNSDVEKYRLTLDRLVFMKDYYRYLWLMPIVLQDPGTIIAKEYSIDDFFGKTCLEIKITYDPKVGNDVWYFYFNPQTYALEGYRFYHDEEANDGEYILLSELTTYKSLKIPRSRKWFTHKEGRFLGSDELVQIKID